MTHPLPTELSWALVIATYKRHHILPRCLRLAATQTYPPREIIVVDASPDWETGRDLVMRELADRYPLAQLTYVKAMRPSLTSQRNQGIDLATADVLFLIDDDSLLYPDCAEEVMKVYAADRQEQVKGVQCILTLAPPDQQPPISSKKDASPAALPNGVQYIPTPPQQTWLRKRVKALLGCEQAYFLPYDATPPAPAIPDAVAGLNVAAVTVMAGYAMTFRRSILHQERFSEVLERYAACEDQDLSYRVSRHGVILNALNARLCHLEISGGRLSLYTVTVLAGLNAAVLQQMHSRDLPYVRRAWQRMLLQRVLISLLKEISERRWQFPRVRGYLFALTQLPVVYAKSPDELLQWYPNFQQKLISADQSG